MEPPCLWSQSCRATPGSLCCRPIVLSLCDRPPLDRKPCLVGKLLGRFAQQRFARRMLTQMVMGRDSADIGKLVVGVFLADRSPMLLGLPPVLCSLGKPCRVDQLRKALCIGHSSSGN